MVNLQSINESVETESIETFMSKTQIEEVLSFHQDRVKVVASIMIEDGWLLVLEGDSVSLSEAIYSLGQQL